MLKVDQYDLIRTSYRVYGKKIKENARETGHSKNADNIKGGYVGYERQRFRFVNVLYERPLFHEDLIDFVHFVSNVPKSFPSTGNTA